MAPPDHRSAVARAREIAASKVGPAAHDLDKAGSFPVDAIAALGEAGLLALTVPPAFGGSGLGPRTFAEVNAVLAEADPSVAMVYMMHVCATEVIAAGAKAGRSPVFEAALSDMSRGKHLTTLAFSEAGSRSHFWAPLSRASRNGQGVHISAKKSWVTSAGVADSYVVTTLSPEGRGPTDSTLYLVPRSASGMRVSAPWDGLGLRATASSPMTLEAVAVADDRRLTDEGGGFATKLNVVLPWFNLASATVSLGICRAVVAATVSHLKTSKFEHLGNTSLGEALPTLRQTLAQMQIDTDGLAHRVDECVGALENPGPSTMLRVLEVKAAAGETAIRVTSSAMHACGGAAFSKHTSIERYFRDAHAGSVMAPTVDVLREFIGKSLLGIPLF
ncbi:MAG TPA: acyl-CoA dehydrogenase family protein [Myxococcaceae bacterium]|nr:acyl-CoA dehydrogenase family protein [Myxococcaceae bacterium]